MAHLLTGPPFSLPQCIGATTVDEHRKHIEKDKALARRFQPVMILEPSEADAKLILRGIQDKYEVHHKCKFSPQAVDAAVELSARYIADRYLPDKVRGGSCTGRGLVKGQQSFSS